MMQWCVVVAGGGRQRMGLWRAGDAVKNWDYDFLNILGVSKVLWVVRECIFGGPEAQEDISNEC